MSDPQGETLEASNTLTRFECRVVSASSALSILSDWPNEARVLLVRGRDDEAFQVNANAELARLLIRLARTDAEPGEPSDSVLSHPVGLEVRPAQQTVTYQGGPIVLTASEFSLLTELLRHRDRVRTLEELADAIWGYQQVGNPNFIQAHVSRMRKKLTAAGCPDVVTTVRSRGYVIRNAVMPSDEVSEPADARPERLPSQALTPAWRDLSAA